MAWTTPRTWVTAEVVTAAIMNTHVRDNETFLRAFHGARMWESAALSQTASGANQLVTWDTTDYDSDSFAVLGSEWFVVPSGFDGYYRVTTNIEYSSNATSTRITRILKNETYTTRTPNGVGTLLSQTRLAGQSGIMSAPLTTWTGPLVAGDHVTIEANQATGGNLAFDPGKDTLWFELHYLGS